MFAFYPTYLGCNLCPVCVAVATALFCGSNRFTSSSASCAIEPFEAVSPHEVSKYLTSYGIGLPYVSEN
jgi:hypothetical protein